MAGFGKALIADIRLFGQDSQPAAGCVHQDAVCLRQLGVWSGGIIAKRLDTGGKSHPFHGLGNELDAVFGHVAADEPPGALHFLSQQQRFAAGGCTEVQHGIARLCLHTEGRQLAGLSLHMVVSLPEELLFRRAALKTGQHTARDDPRFRALGTILHQQLTQLCRAGLERVCPQAGHTAVCRMSQDAKCLLRVMAVQKLRDLPAGGAENHELFDFILENGFVQVIDTGLAQDRIDQA